MKTFYKSDDGKTFDSYKECMEYESNKSRAAASKLLKEVDEAGEKYEQALRKLEKEFPDVYAEEFGVEERLWKFFEGVLHS